jgi:acetoin utilization protein AcuC
MKKTAFIYSNAFSHFDYGPAHPLKTSRLSLTYELIKAFDLLSLANTRLVKARNATDEELLSFHEKEYIEVLKAANAGFDLPYASFYGLGSGDNPVFKGVFDWSRLVAGASLQAAELVESGEATIAFSLSGGLHHALSARASGFCYINDIVVAILSLLKKGRRVAYIDIDAHHGDGVQEAFYGTDQVLTISIHETGKVLFPGTGFEHETGQGKGQGYSVNVPMSPYSDDELFVHAFNEVVPPLVEKFSPDVVVTQLGVDSFSSDPLAHLNYTNNGFCEVVRKIKEIAPGWVALGGGGYDVVNVAKAWTRAWAIMNDVEIPDDIPEDFLKKYRYEGFTDSKMKDEVYREAGLRKEQMREEGERVIRYIKEKIFVKTGTSLP